MNFVFKQNVRKLTLIFLWPILTVRLHRNKKKYNSSQLKHTCKRLVGHIIKSNFIIIIITISVIKVVLTKFLIKS